jgi:hypothetical protein
LFCATSILIRRSVHPVEGLEQSALVENRDNLRHAERLRFGHRRLDHSGREIRCHATFGVGFVHSESLRACGPARPNPQSRNAQFAPGATDKQSSMSAAQANASAVRRSLRALLDNMKLRSYIFGDVDRHVTAYPPPSLVAFTWIAPSWEAATQVEIRFSSEAGGTRVELEHSGWEQDAKTREAHKSCDSGWDFVLATISGG